MERFESNREKKKGPERGCTRMNLNTYKKKNKYNRKEENRELVEGAGGKRQAGRQAGKQASRQAVRNPLTRRCNI
ncbi:hypothetical protein RUM43_002355 [Polyplax serrata]|uniref:Uncharacterized protein n=1 Tax=Polyplax serrata TaxID=468196 RepID=A0AAN8P262_POLSC